MDRTLVSANYWTENELYGGTPIYKRTLFECVNRATARGRMDWPGLTPNSERNFAMMMSVLTKRAPAAPAEPTPAETTLADLENRLAHVRAEIEVLAGLLETHERAGDADEVAAVVAGRPMPPEQAAKWTREIGIFRRAERQLVDDLRRARTSAGEAYYVSHLAADHDEAAQRFCVAVQMLSDAVAEELAIQGKAAAAGYTPNRAIPWWPSLQPYQTALSFCGPEGVAESMRQAGFSID